MPIPCGWPIILLIIAGLFMINIPLILGLRRGYVRGGWKVLLIILVVVFFMFPTIYLVVMGPATVQLYKMFFSGG